MKLNVGCGHVHLPQAEGWVNLDINPQTGCDVAAAVPHLPFADNALEHILASHFIEHVPTNLKIAMFNEFWRILKPGASLQVFVPYAFHEAAHQDPTHVSYWVPASGMYFTEQMSYLQYGIRVWSTSRWILESNGSVVDAKMTK